MSLTNQLLQNNLNRLRLLCQSLFAIFCLYIGWQFYSFYLWTTETGKVFTPRPPAVEAFLPLGALISVKRLFLGGEYDTIHPAGLTIFIAALLIALFLRKGFCGWICPVGFASNLAERAGKRMRISFSLPAWIDLPLLSIKYLLLGFFSYLILWQMDMESLTAFHHSSYNLISDAKMLHFFLQPSILTGAIMLFLFLISFVIKNFWCRYLCPYGGLLGLLALLSPFQIKRAPDTCINCKKCEQICPSSIRITDRKTVRNAECIGCLECLPVCPAKDCLTLGLAGKRRVNPILLPVLILGLFLLSYLTATVTGHWQTQVTVDIFRQLYQQITTIGHP
ncbi:MAG: 4Fe-4S binding protein [Proteobacteria bacterium]|nr:4Fe-4S binding protein [Pseudomonadota bacterium]MBU1231818.1 4Fe-4S binding protein [Pseudomonadota bacterium]MBU1419987.1 4Fe-4S binding protein [Pseudomonadota bacterium]MBU1454770.1 4Fe-4S binding protein [Pseudomonadota bacterium]